MTYAYEREVRDVSLDVESDGEGADPVVFGLDEGRDSLDGFNEEIDEIDEDVADQWLRDQAA